MEVKVLQLQKRSSYTFEHIQDKYALNTEKKCFALADGTTQSFRSEEWAKMLTRQFTNNPTFDPALLTESFKESIQCFKGLPFEFDKNPAKASLEKAKMQQGGTSTFIGIQFSEPCQFNLISCGDSNLFKIGVNEQFDALPHSNLEALDSNKYYINTEKLANDKIPPSYFKVTKAPYQEGDIFILATDALSRLFLKKPEVAIKIISIKSFDELRQFCLAYWDNRQLEEDDISAIVIHTDAPDKVTLIIPPADFSFPKEEEVPFVPGPPPQEFKNPKMTELTNQHLQVISKTLQEIKQQQFTQKIVAYITLALIVIGLLIVTGSRKKESEKFETIMQKQERIHQTKVLQMMSQIESLQKEIDCLSGNINFLNATKQSTLDNTKTENPL